MTLAGTPLTLLKQARLDAVVPGYILIGSDGAAVRWAKLSDTGEMSLEHAFGLPTVGVASQPLFAVASSSGTSAADTVLIGWLGPDAATGKKVDLSVIAVPADGSPPMGPASVIHEFPGGYPVDGSSVVMVSSRKGTNAGVAWFDPGSAQVQLAAIDATGALVGTATPTAPVTQPYDCLSFQAGKDDLTLVYHATITSQSGAGWVVVEANEGGSVDSYTTLGYSDSYTQCALVTPTGNGYGIVWQDATGGQLGIYTSGSANLPASAPFAPSSGFGGAYLQPPIVGLASFQQDFGVLFQRVNDAELWRLDQTGNRRAGALVLPSAHGDMGIVSTTLAIKDGMLAQGGGLVTTYADYTGSLSGADGGTTRTGNRVFLNAICR